MLKSIFYFLAIVPIILEIEILMYPTALISVRNKIKKRDFINKKENMLIYFNMFSICWAVIGTFTTYEGMLFLALEILTISRPKIKDLIVIYSTISLSLIAFILINAFFLNIKLF